MKPELLAPAGNWTMLTAAKNAGADAIYFGIKGLNMRHSAKNFEIKDLKGIGKIEIKKYLALNTIFYDKEIKNIKEIIEEAYSSNIDAIICWDMGVLQLAKDIGIPIHLSTQASISNIQALNFYKNQGVKRFILARELSLEQIKHIKQGTSTEIECFIHGAMCVSVSGRCFMSHFVRDMSANRGRCFQPCRRPYTIKDKELDYELEVGNNYVLSPKDLCTLPFIDKLIESKIDSFKIEGRSKTPEYVDTVVRAYRKAIDAHEQGNLNKELKNKLLKDLNKSYNRGFSKGFYLGRPMQEWATSEGNDSKTRKLEVGKVINFYKKNNVAVIKILAEGISLGDNLLIIGNKTGVVKQEVNSIEDDHKPIKKAEKGDIVAVSFNSQVRENDMVYKII